MTGVLPGGPATVLRSGRSRREEHERRQRRRANTIAAISTVVVAAAIVATVAAAPQWPAVRRSFFNAEQFRASFPEIWAHFGLNVRIFLTAEVLILVISALVAIARNSRAPALFPIRLLVTVYVDVVRGIPLILVLYLLGFGVPALRLSGVPNDPVFWAIVALTVGYSAYVSEVFRAGIESVHESQRAAARSLGLSSGQTMQFVILPQAVRRVVPPLLNDFIALQKDSALVAFIGPIEAFRQSQIDASRTFNFTPYLAAALLFLLLTIPLTRLTEWLSRRQQRRTSGGTVR